MLQLELLLDEWQNSSKSRINRSEIPLKILAEAEQTVSENDGENSNRSAWFRFLDITRKFDFLIALGDCDVRKKWTEIVFKILQITNYNLRDMMEQRVAEHPHQTMFRDLSSSLEVDWTYDQINRHLREIATLFYQIAGSSPRVAIYTENCFEGACADLACLMFDIYDTPLSPHFKQEILITIFNELQINIALADNEDRLTALLNVREKTKVKFSILSLQPVSQKNQNIPYIVEVCKNFTRSYIDTLLGQHIMKQNNQVATTMFTSGSAGLPKGVSFSLYNIVSKRFARAAALPEVGNETFLCYLPLFHTFGRYLEMTGVIFWSGTYIFAGNTSSETLLSLFHKVNPTGFISIPLRWQDLYERCQETIAGIENEELRSEAVRNVVGSNLHWGLSAAGYLDPNVFRFFNQYGIHLNSGFGMTEATGGITMTPPGGYKDSSVGIPLPGIMTRLTAESELELSGHYVGRYLENAGPDEIIPYPVSSDIDYWMKTGDVFKITPDGYFEIIDRVKDIYKNNRGQTVAPQTIEKKFYNVPGIQSVFLVGDNRPYNVLLIVPDRNDPLFLSLDEENLNEYFHQIVMAANSDVAPYERVINFSVLNREFSSEKGELTPKGSFNRKAIENSFKDIIDTLYQSKVAVISAGSFSILIPKWFFRDLGILETDLKYEQNTLINKISKSSLIIRKIKDDNYQIGNMKYQISSNQIDLGILTRQPKIWIGNPSLVAFCPVKEGWDVPLGNISPSIGIVRFIRMDENDLPVIHSIRNQQLIQINNLLFKAFFSDFNVASHALEDLTGSLSGADPRLAITLRYRIEALAFHPDEEIRCLAYRLILLKAPNPEDIQSMPTFIESGLTFLNEASIQKIASGNFGKHRLDALKQRLYWYRTHLKWPAGKRQRNAFADVIGLLHKFARLHLEFYVPVRAELSRWILHKQDPFLSGLAESYFYNLANYFEKAIEANTAKQSLKLWKSRLVFENGISESEKFSITEIFRSSTFLNESVILTFNEWNFSLEEVPEKGIWIMRLLAFKEFKHYRLSINTTSGKHFDLHMVMSEDPAFKGRPETFYWLASLAGFPFGPAVAPMLGSSRPNLGVLTTQYIDGLTAWDKIRELSEIHRSSGLIRNNAWKKIFIKSFAVIFTAWEHSGRLIVPGAISPANIVIPEMDFRDSAVILSLAGWSEYKNTLSLIEPMLRDFYCRTASVYPWCRKQLRIFWIFDACIESLGKEKATVFLKQLDIDLNLRNLNCFDDTNLHEHIEEYLERTLNRFYLPLALFSAIDQYQEWYRMNPLTTNAAKEHTILELFELYKLQQHSELTRYFLYRHTFFSDTGNTIQETFDQLLSKMKDMKGGLAIQLTELSDLQAEIVNPEMKLVFSRMVFPRLQGEMGIDFLKIGDNKQEHVVVRFTFHDKTGQRYTLREPVEARETGQLYQLFFREKYPKEISDYDHQYVLTDEHEKIVGGITYRYIEDHNILLDGIVVTSALQGKGIASGMLEKFFASMSAQGVEVVRAHFLFGNYYMKHFFEVDKNWGALIKKLN